MNQEYIDFIVDCGTKLWEFFTSGWFVASILFIRFLFPKIIGLFKNTMGR